MRKSNAPPGSKQRRTLVLVAAPPPVVSRDQRKNAGQLPLRLASTGRSAYLGALLPPTGDSASQNRSIFQATEPLVFVPPREKEKAVEGRYQACNVPSPSETPAPVEVTKEGKNDPVHQRTTALMTCGNPSAAVSLATTSCGLKTHGSTGRRKQAEQKSLDYKQSLLQQYELQQHLPQDDQQQRSIRQCESNKLCERTSSLTTSHQQPIAAVGSAVEGNARAIRSSSPSSSNMQQTVVEQQTHPSGHHPVVAPIKISDLATDQRTNALNEECLRVQLVQRDQEIADIMDRLAQSEEAQCVMAVAEAETSSRLNKELSRLQSELNFKSHSIREAERELKRIKTEKAIAVKEEALHMAAEARKTLLERAESKATTHLKPVLQQQSQKVDSRKVDGKHGSNQPMPPAVTRRTPYSGHSSPQLQATYTFQFQQLLSFLSGDGASDILSLYNLAPDATSALNSGGRAVGDQPTCPSQSVLEMLPAVPPVSCNVGTVPPSSLPRPPISGLPSPEHLCGGKGSPPTCVPPPQGSSAPVEDGNQSSTCLVVNAGSLLNQLPSNVNSKERLQMQPKRLNECLLDIQLGRQGGSGLVIVLGEYLSLLGTEIQVLRLLQGVIRLLTGVLGLCSEARALVLSIDNTTSISLQNAKQHLQSLSCSQSSSLLDTQRGVEDSGGPALQVKEDMGGNAASGYSFHMRKYLLSLFQWCMMNIQDGIGTTDTGGVAGGASIVDLAEDLCNTLLACLQEASAVQLEAWGGLCDGMALHFAFFAKSSSPRLKELAMELLRCLMQSKKLFSRISSCSTALPTLEVVDDGRSSCGNIPTHSIISPSSNLPLIRRLCNVSFSFQPGSVQSPLRPISLGLYLRLIRLCLLLCVRYGKDAFNHLLRDDKESGFTPIHLLPKLVHFIRVELEGWEQVRDENVLSPYVLSSKKKAIHQTRSAVIRESFQLLVRLAQNSPRPLRETVVAAGMHDSLLALVDKLYNGASFESLNVAVEAKNLVAQVNTL